MVPPALHAGPVVDLKGQGRAPAVKVDPPFGSSPPRHDERRSFVAHPSDAKFLRRPILPFEPQPLTDRERSAAGLREPRGESLRRRDHRPSTRLPDGKEHLHLGPVPPVDDRWSPRVRSQRTTPVPPFSRQGGWTDGMALRRKALTLQWIGGLAQVRSATRSRAWGMRLPFLKRGSRLPDLNRRPDDGSGHRAILAGALYSHPL